MSQDYKSKSKIYASHILRHPSTFLLKQRTNGLRNVEQSSVGISCAHKRQANRHIILSLEADHVECRNVKDRPHGAERLED